MKTGNRSLRRRVGFRWFTLVEMMIVLVIIMILTAMFLPMVQRAKARARFVRWFAFNRNCNNDPTCVINFNFQEGSGDMLNNYSAGADIENYNPEQYQGYLRNAKGGDHNFEWVESGGRWGFYKHALQFNGADTYVLIPGTQGLDFTPLDDFTVLTWVKFDELGLGDCPFSKSLWGTASDAACQYDLYSNPWAGSFGQGSFDVDVFTTCATWLNTDIDFEKKGWIHLALRYEHKEVDEDGEVRGRTMVFVNGQPLGDFIETTDENPHTASATGWQACSEMRVPLVLGGAGCYTKYWDKKNYDPNNPGDLENEWHIRFFFKGKMDEFLVYKRALPDGEIRGHYDMGKF